MKNNCYKTLMTFCATGLACAAVLIGTPAPTDPVAGEPGKGEPWVEISGEGIDDTDDEPGIMPLDDQALANDQKK